MGVARTSESIMVSQPSQASIAAGTWPWWRTTRQDRMVLPYFILIHLTAVIGLIWFPLPGWRIFLAAAALSWLGGIGTTVCYHRALAHRALKLAPWLERSLTLCAVFNGSGLPLTWVASHRLHHAEADTPEDISSPIWSGFWWAHLRWLWQADAPPLAKYCPDIDAPSYRWWRPLQAPILSLSFFCGAYFGLAAFFWLGAIRLVFSLHAQCFVNSVCHSQPDTPIGEDSSRNVRWLGLMQFFQGENWHRNHHARPALARLGRNWRQPDIGYILICIFEKLGLAREIHRAREA